MSASVCLVIISIFILCVIIFTKTVSNDAKNDFRIRDILSNPSSFDEESSKPNIKKNEEETKLYKNMSQNTQNGYETKVHEVDSAKEEQHSEQSYYQKDRYMETNKYNDQTESKPDYQKSSATAVCDEEEEETTNKKCNTYNLKREYSYQEEKRNLFYYVKTFWRGITFTLGLLVSLYAFNGIAFHTQTSNDAIVYSIWLLIGVVLVK